MDISELMEVDREGGVIRFGGQRAIIIDATAVGLLRNDLINQFGVATARAVLTRFGFAHGWRVADAIQSQISWDSSEDRDLAGDRIPVIQGMYRLTAGTTSPMSKEGAFLQASFEAEQHIAHLGRSDSCVCWMITGLVSGYLSRVHGKEIYVLEERCIGRGDAVCHLLGRTHEEWGDERAGELRFFRSDRLQEWLDVSLHQTTEALKRAEQKLRERTRALARVARDVEDPLGMVARSPAMRHLFDIARRIAKVDSTILITGESGTGKERIARFIHEESSRAPGPFIAINCAAITETLLESELFGHVRGAFTGATQDRLGLFEAANRGTLFLDEVSEISAGMQVKLLRALQEREIRRVGESRSRSVDVRVIAATNSELVESIAAGRFRKDLYYRLNVVELHVPPLRNRREDILPLARVLLAEAAIRLKRPVTGLSPQAADQLLRYGWPGNVRELGNAMERAVALAGTGRTEIEDLPEEVRQAVNRIPLSGPVKALDEVEREYILAVLDLNEGNRTKAAEQLGIGLATLHRKLKRYRVRLRGPDATSSEPDPAP